MYVPTPAQLQAGIAGLKRVRGYYDTGMSYYRQAKRLKKMVGEAVGAGTAEATFNADLDDEVFATRAMYSSPLIRIERDKTTFDKRKRYRDIVNVRGVKWCFTVSNNCACDLTVHYAIVKRKDATTPSGDDFLGDIGGAKRYCSVAEATYSDHRLDCLPVNTDDYKILTHKKFLLNGKDGALVGQNETLKAAKNRRNYRHVEKYIKINRQFRFTETDINPIENLYICWWAYRRGEASKTNVLSAYNITQDLTCYFRSLI